MPNFSASHFWNIGKTEIMPRGILILKVENGSHAREVIDRIFGCDSFAVGHELLTIYGDDENHWFEPLGFTLTEQAFFRRFFSGGVSQPEQQRTTEMSAVMDHVKKAGRYVAENLGLVDSPAEIARAKEREAKRMLLTTEDSLVDAMKAESREVEAVKAKVTTGELHPGAILIPTHRYNDAANKVQQCKRARTALFNTADAGLRARYFRKKKEAVSASTRINLLERQQLPDSSRELAKLQEVAQTAAANVATYQNRDANSRAQLENEVRKANRDVVNIEGDIEGYNLELASLKEKHVTLQAELKEIKAAMLAS
ncbi:MAG: hypothetical protein ACKVP0_05605 [Pirellulaceae bacterium]